MRGPVAADMRAIFKAPDRDEAEPLQHWCCSSGF
jgi:hypothetical protein